MIWKKEPPLPPETPEQKKHRERIAAWKDYVDAIGKMAQADLDRAARISLDQISLGWVKLDSSASVGSWVAGQQATNDPNAGINPNWAQGMQNSSGSYAGGLGNMGWNYETGKDEKVAYAGGGNGPVTPQLIVPAHAYEAYWNWTCAEKVARNWSNTTPGTLEAWRVLGSKLTFDQGKLNAQFRKDYIQWLLAGRKDPVPTTPGIDELKLSDSQLPLLERMAVIGYRELAKQFHPDRGGSPDGFAKLQEAKKQMDIVIGEVRRLLGGEEGDGNE